MCSSLLTKPFAKICKEAGVSKKLSSKVFRRTFNDLCLEAGVEQLVRLATIGHADIAANRLYASIEPEQKQTALAKVFQLVEMGA